MNPSPHRPNALILLGSCLFLASCGDQNGDRTENSPEQPAQIELEPAGAPVIPATAESLPAGLDPAEMGWESETLNDQTGTIRGGSEHLAGAVRDSS